jgi:hypothetical protein
MLQQSSAGDRGNPSPTAARTRRPRGPVGSPRPAARGSNGAELAGACSYKRRSTRETGRRRRERAYRTNRVESVPAGGAARGSDRAFPPRFCARRCCGAAERACGGWGRPYVSPPAEQKEAVGRRVPNGTAQLQMGCAADKKRKWGALRSWAGRAMERSSNGRPEQSGRVGQSGIVGRLSNMSGLRPSGSRPESAAFEALL